MKFIAEFDAAGNQPIAPLPPGTYRVVIRDTRDTVTRDNVPMASVRFEVQGGHFRGRSVWDNMTTTKKGMRRLAAFHHSIGLPCQGNIEVDTSMWPGRELLIVVAVESYNEKLRNRIRRFLPTSATRKQTHSTKLSQG